MKLKLILTKKEKELIKKYGSPLWFCDPQGESLLYAGDRSLGNGYGAFGVEILLALKKELEKFE